MFFKPFSFLGSNDSKLLKFWALIKDNNYQRYLLVITIDHYNSI